ncbi:dTMP kinase [Candidatus Bathyarchaeota archaeon CG_4_8_14_3_um_filter_42_8]|nr:MAG: dTMP kinase [Candidatus Bathyarchaeota archaeon CG_4_8_14_3_um_filter_42_8]
MKGKGFFICVEGLDGCGKTTQTKLLVRKLRKMGWDAVYTAEPSRGKIGQFIKKYCLHGEKRTFPIVEALLFVADRFEHVEREVIPALNEGKVVVSDRYVYSSLAYQGATGLDLKWIEMINEHAIRPDLAIFVDVEPEAVIKRLKPKKSVMENLETQRKVREVYVKFVEKGELVRIDGNKYTKEVADDILKVVLRFLEKRG